MTRRLPLIPTLLVAAAVAVMIALGVWQIRRAGEKEALLARYSSAAGLPAVRLDEGSLAKDPLPLFRRAEATCRSPSGRRARGGRNRAGEIGYAHIVQCAAAAGQSGLSVDVGWSKNPNAAFSWMGGKVSGIVAPDSQSGMRLVAEVPAEGLQASAPPSIETIPNNHRFYAVQWFLFAGLALLIYLLALRRKLKDAAANRGGQDSMK